MEDYFPTSVPSSAWIQQPFIAEINSNEQLNLHEQHLELQSSQVAKTKLSSSSLIEFWCSMLQEYPELAKELRKHQLHFQRHTSVNPPCLLLSISKLRTVIALEVQKT